MTSLHVGTDIELEPVFLKLISIDMMFQKQFWNLLERFIAQSTCNDNTSVQTIANKKNLVIQALNDYNNNASIPQGNAVYLCYNLGKYIWFMPKTINENQFEIFTQQPTTTPRGHKSSLIWRVVLIHSLEMNHLIQIGMSNNKENFNNKDKNTKYRSKLKEYSRLRNARWTHI